MYVTTLTAIPPRFDQLGPTLESVLAQEIKPEAVRLYIPKHYRRFSDWDGSLPDVPRGVEIIRTEEDLGPATKVLFAADELRGEDVSIMFCDDDRIYLPDWSTRFMQASAAHPGAAIVSSGFDVEQMGFTYHGPRAMPRAKALSKAEDLGYQWQRLKQKLARIGRPKRDELKAPRSRIGKSGYVDIGEGFGGFLVRPEFFDRDAWVIPPVLWAVDDVWLSGQLARKNIPIWGEAHASRLLTTRYQKRAALHAAVIEGAGREDANYKCAEYMRDTYGVWGKEKTAA